MSPHVRDGRKMNYSLIVCSAENEKTPGRRVHTPSSYRTPVHDSGTKTLPSVSFALEDGATTATINLVDERELSGSGHRGRGGQGGGGGGGEALSGLMRKKMAPRTRTPLFPAVLGVSMIYFLTMASVGVRHLENCPVQPKIPIYLFVGGCFWMLKLVSLLWQQMRRHRSHRSSSSGGNSSSSILTESDDRRQQRAKRNRDDYEDDYDDTADVIMSRSSRFSLLVLDLFLVAWSICGGCWVLGAWRPRFQATIDAPKDWCHVTAYMFALAQVLLSYVVAVVAMVIVAVTTASAWRQKMLEN